MAGKKKCVQKLKGPMSGARTLKTIVSSGCGSEPDPAGDAWCQSCVIQGLKYRCAACDRVAGADEFETVHLCSGALLVCRGPSCNASV